jgi:DTW domain-containing protein YfiP
MPRTEPSPELGYVPEGGSTRRCQSCGRDGSVAWLCCAIAQLHAEEKWMIWQALREDEALQAFRAMRKKAIT